MAYKDLHEFVAALEQAGELVRIKAPVDALLELSEIAARVMKQPCPDARGPRHDPVNGVFGGKALLFENVVGHDMPVLINAYGSYRRMCMALGCDDFDVLAARVNELVQPQIPAGLFAKLKKIPDLIHLASLSPKIRQGRFSAPCQQIVQTDDADLTRLPVIQCWPDDGKDNPALPHARRYITMGCVVTEHPMCGTGILPVSSSVSSFAEQQRQRQRQGQDGPGTHGQDAHATQRHGQDAHATQRHGQDAHATQRHGQDVRATRNVGIYRVQLLGPKRAAMHIHPPHDGAANWRAWKDLGKPMPAAIVLGGEPTIAYAASAPLPPGMDELILAGFLQGQAIELVQCKTIDLAVPANAEIVIEGLVSHDELVTEGPFGDHTGFYSPAGAFPVFRVTAITRRRDAIYPTTVVGYPPMEDYYMGKATERIFLPVLRMLCPEIVDYDLPMFGAFHNFVFVQIRKQYANQARRVMHALWGAGQLAFSKFIVVVDENVNVHDPNDVWFAVGANCDPSRDIEHASGPLDILDHAAPDIGSGGKLGIDATRKLPGEGPIRDWPEPLKMSQEIRELVERRWKEYGIGETGS
jgi:4-hydroxy-3-polyprenylbenzoate decarboxylase